MKQNEYEGSTSNKRFGMKGKGLEDTVVIDLDNPFLQMYLQDSVARSGLMGSVLGHHNLTKSPHFAQERQKQSE